MNGLKVIENNLVPVYETSTGEKVVYGSELYAILEVKSNYRDWIRNRFADIEAIENEDFEAAKILAPSGQTRKDHIIKLDYHVLGGNGMITKMKQEIDELHLKKKGD